MKYFHFSLGPVQQFISQARRTRDFWAGSFLLSWLSGVAMNAVLAQKKVTDTSKMDAVIKFPKPDANELAWIIGTGKGTPPAQGAIPNRFMAVVDDDFDPSLVVQAVQQAWLALADIVRINDFDDSFFGLEQAKIWQQQHKHFWEVLWVITDTNMSDALDKRKNWRHHFAPEEAGEKCHLMEGWQELSGVIGVFSGRRKERDKFWSELAKKHKNSSDFNETEHLCAIAYVKRRFVRYFDQLDQKIVLEKKKSGELFSMKVKGWKVAHNRPSVVYMAAVHWLEQLVLAISENHEHVTKEVNAVVNTAKHIASQDETKADIACLNKSISALPPESAARKLVRFNGALFFEHLADSYSAMQDRPFTEEDVKAGKKAEFSADAQLFRQKFKALFEALEAQGNTDGNVKLNRSPSPFYAVLAMDGDQLGIHMSDEDKQGPIANALNAFTKKVGVTVQAYNGSLIYAGGDDVLALLPLEDALPCADALRSDYLAAFKQHSYVKDGQEKIIPSTLSGGLIFAHIKSPLTEVLRRSHKLLDGYAKEKLGRNAIAISVLKPGGEVIKWGQQWPDKPDEAVGTEETKVLEAVERVTPIMMLTDLADSFANVNDDTDYSSRFFYRVREHLKTFEGFDLEKLEMSNIIELIKSDYRASMQGRTADNAAIDDKVSALTKLMQTDGQFNSDVLMLVRFLAAKGLEKR